MSTLPPPPSSAGVPSTTTFPGTRPATAARPIPAPSAAVQIKLCPQAWPISGSASYSARNATAGPVPLPATSARNAVGRPPIPRWIAKPWLSSVSHSHFEDCTSWNAISGCAWIRLARAVSSSAAASTVRVIVSRIRPPMCPRVRRADAPLRQTDPCEAAAAHTQHQAIRHLDLRVRLLDPSPIEADPTLGNQPPCLAFRLGQSRAHQQVDDLHLPSREIGTAETRLRNLLGQLPRFELALEGPLRPTGGLRSVPHAHDSAGQPCFRVARMHRAVGKALGRGADVVHRQIRGELQVVCDEVVRQRHRLPVHLVGWVGDADGVAEALAHLLGAVEADEQRGEQHDLWL